MKKFQLHLVLARAKSPDETDIYQSWRKKPASIYRETIGHFCKIKCPNSRPAVQILN